MYLRMLRHASRADSSVHQFMMRVPRDVIERVRGRRIEVELPASPSDPAAVFSATLGTFAKGSLHTRDGATADSRRLAVVAHLSRVYEAARQGVVALSHKQTVGLTERIYSRLRALNDDNPGSAEQWAAWKAFTRAALEGRLAPGDAPVMGWRPRTEEQAAVFEIFGRGDLTAGVNVVNEGTYDETALRERCGRLVLWLLHDEGIEIDGPSHLALLREVAKAALQAGWQLKRQAEGDYRPDPLEGRFPAFQTVSARLAFSDLFERWKTEVKPAPSTITSWRGVIKSLVAHLGHDDVTRVTERDVIAWKDRLISEGKRPSTINDGHLAALRAILAYGKVNRLVSENVAAGVRVQDRAQAGARMLPYEDAEIARLLQIAARETAPFKRWLPLLAVCTGARIGELAQAWGSQVREIDGVLVLAIEPSPDGGTLKNAASERLVPLHPALIEAGFVEFARGCGHRPMFYRRPARPGSDGRHPSKGTSNHLATWIREQGFNDPRKAPSHACRHWWKSAASRVGISDSMADALQGHVDGSSAGTYRHFSLQAMADAVARIPVPEG